MNTVILGIGNTLKGDDGVGPYLVSRISYPVSRSDILLIDAGTAPENYLQKIIDFKPGKIMIIDAVDFGGIPGKIKRFQKIESAGISISTHNMPPELFIEILKNETGADVEIIAIQPKHLKFNEELSSEAKESADTLVDLLISELDN